MHRTGDFRDPRWQPSEKEHAALREGFRRTVLWRQAMAARGEQVLAMTLTPDEERAKVDAWWEAEGHDRSSSRSDP